VSKQEEIDRLLNLWADDYCLFVEKTCEHRGMYCYCCSEGEALKCLKERLGEQGVVIKVDRELPEIDTPFWLPGWKARYVFRMGVADTKSKYKKIGLLAVEPLIKE